MEPITPKGALPCQHLLVPKVTSTNGVDQTRRLERLRSLNKSAKDLAAYGIGGYTYWRDMLAGKKSFGEKKARELEEAIPLPPGWFDQEDGEEVDARLEKLLARLEGMPRYSHEAFLLAADLDTITDPAKRFVAYQRALSAIEQVRSGRTAGEGAVTSAPDADTPTTPQEPSPKKHGATGAGGPSRHSKR